MAKEYKLTDGNGKILVTLKADHDLDPGEALLKIVEELAYHIGEHEQKEEGAPEKPL